MRLPGLKRDTQPALDQARIDLTNLAARIAELQQRRDAALADDDGIDQIAAIDRQADEQGRRLRAVMDKIGLLEGRLASEQEEQRGRDFVAAVAAIEGPLARRTKAAEELERALQRVGACAKEFTAQNAAVLEAWPTGVPLPLTAYPYHALSTDRMGALIETVFVGHELYNPRTRLRVQPTEFVSRTVDIAEKVRLAGFAATEAQLADAWLADLKTANLPLQPEGHNAEEEVAA